MIPYFDRTNGDAFKPSDAQQAAREALGKQFHALILANLEAIGAFITPAKLPENPTENQAKRLASKGRSLMLALTIPLPAFTFEQGDETVTTRKTVLGINATIPTDGKAEVEANAEPVVKALTWSELKALQAASRTAKK